MLYIVNERKQRADKSKKALDDAGKEVKQAQDEQARCKADTDSTTATEDRCKKAAQKLRAAKERLAAARREHAAVSGPAEGDTTTARVQLPRWLLGRTDPSAFEPMVTITSTTKIVPSKEGDGKNPVVIIQAGEAATNPAGAMESLLSNLKPQKSATTTKEGDAVQSSH